MKPVLAAIITIALFQICRGNSVKKIDLDDVAWTVKNSNGSIKIPAKVPGGIYSDLQTHGILSDIFYRFNDVDYRWVAKTNWTYSCSFKVDDLKSRKVLVFEGLDTVADIYLNGHLLGSTDNMFVKYKFPVDSLLKNNSEKLNTLAIKFTSPILAANYRSGVKEVKPLCTPKSYQGECHVNQLRKMQASFAWDWGPAFPSVGIWKPVYFLTYDYAIIEHVAVDFENDSDSWTITEVVYFYIPPDFGPVRGELSLILKLNVSEEIEVTRTETLDPDEKGEAVTTISCRVPKKYVKLWWPNGYRPSTVKAKLYRLKTIFKVYDEVTQKEIKIGFRTVELIQEEMAAEENGLSFYFKVNGISMFAKGSNWIPGHILPEYSTSESVFSKKLNDAAYANMNMLRVWGGGVYESDEFYELADELGILIWQDMMFACSMYPVNDKFLSSVETEVKQQVQRLQHHPSIALWAGNNENEAALSGNWYLTSKEYDRYKKEYITLYVKTIKPMVEAIDATRPFVISSPSNGKESEQEGYVSRNPNNPLMGDIHYYNYLNDGWDPSYLTLPRFASEYGYQSLPSFDSLAAETIPQDLIVTSNFMLKRQHHIFGYLEMEIEISKQLPIPDDFKTIEEFPYYIYYTQINQAMSIKTETEFYRRGRGIFKEYGEGFTMGALYWQLNDVWPAPSWSSIELNGKWKMLHYFAKKFFAPVLISPWIEYHQDTLHVTLVSDLIENIPYLSFKMHIFRWDSFSPVYTKEISPLELVGLSANDVFTQNAKDLLKETSACGNDTMVTLLCFFTFRLTNMDNSIDTSNFLFPAPLKEVANIKKANAQIKDVYGPSDITFMLPVYFTATQEFEITISVDYPALFVWLDSHKIDGYFEENGFLLLKSGTTLKFWTSENITSLQLKKALTITCVNDNIF